MRTGNFYAGSSFGQSGEDRGSFYLRLKALKDRPGVEQSSRAIQRRLRRDIQQRVGDARVVLTTPPAVRGFSSESGLSLELLDRSGGQLSLEQFGRVAAVADNAVPYLQATHNEEPGGGGAGAALST